MAVLFRFEVHTPNRLFYSDQVEAIVLTLIDGEAAVYANHVPFSAPVIPCLLKIKEKDGIWKTAFADEGILEVTNKKTVLISDSAEWPQEIDCERAMGAKKKAEETLQGKSHNYITGTATAALKRANMRIRASKEVPEKI